MSIVSVHGPHTWGDAADQANDPIGMATAAAATGTAYNATTTSSATSAAAVTATATAEAFTPTRITGY